jgi:transcription-repair coupling factor (superfamily II helicase)
VSCPVGLEATRLLAVLDADATGSVIHLAADEQRARDVAHCLAVLAPDREVLVFPPWDCLPYATAIPSAEAMGMRMSVLRRLAADQGSKVVVTSPEAALQRVPRASAIRTLLLRSGQELDAEAFRRFCQEAGYAIDDRVDEPGEVAIRGGVIDIFPGGRSRPFRL